MYNIKGRTEVFECFLYFKRGVSFTEKAEVLGPSTKRKCISSKTEESLSMKLLTCGEFSSGLFKASGKKI
jgi:hypothetical protein